MSIPFSASSARAVGLLALLLMAVDPLSLAALVAAPQHQTKNATAAAGAFAQRLQDTINQVAAAERRPQDTQALGRALARLGTVQSDGWLVSEAEASLKHALSLLDSSGSSAAEILTVRQHLVDVMLAREELRQAVAVAGPEADLVRASVALRRGDYSSGAATFLAVLGKHLGIAQPSLYALEASRSRGLVAAGPNQTSLVRRLLLCWASSVVGQEEMIPPMTAGLSGTGPSELPAYALATEVFAWIDPSALGSGETLPLTERAQLGIAAYLHGESLRRAGYLQQAGTDIRFADWELREVPGAEGWTYRAEIARVALEADYGQDSLALNDAQRLTEEIRQAVGPTSMAYLEAGELLSRLQLRVGDVREALNTATSAIAIAAVTLPPGHSLSRKLRTRAAQALLADGNAAGALRIIAAAEGLQSIPRISKSADSALQVALRRAPTVTTRANLLRAAVGLAPVDDSMPIASRVVDIELASMAGHAAALIPDPDLHRGAQEFAFALQAQESAFLDQSVHSGSNSAQTQYYSLLGMLRHYPESLERLMGPVMPAGVWLYGSRVQDEAEKDLTPEGLLPSEFRLCVRPGEDMDDLEVLLHDLRTVPGSPINGSRASLALVILQAALGGDALGIIAIRAEAIAETRLGRTLDSEHSGLDLLINGQSPDRMAAVKAVAAEALARRLRGLIWDLAQNEAADSGAVRARYLALMRLQRREGTLVYTAFNHRFAGVGTALRGLDYAATAEGFQSRLAPSDAVVIWVPLGDTTEVFLIAKHQVDWQELHIGRVHLEQLVGDIETEMSTAEAEVVANGMSPISEYPSAVAFELYQALFAKIAPDLRGITHLYVAPMGVLGALPLETLITKTPSHAHRLHWLAEQFAITRLPTLVGPAVFDHGPSGTLRARKRLLAIGAPQVDEETSRAQPHSQDSAIAAQIASLGDLPGGLGLMQHVARSMGASDMDRAILSGPDATHEAVVGRLQNSNEDLLLFFTHGVVRQSFVGVGEPALVLSARRKPDFEDDGLLRESEIVGMSLSADVAMLVGCSTAPTGAQSDEPVSGLASAFLAAGARRVIASFWNIRTEMAERLAKDFVHEKYERHLSASAALQSAEAMVRSGTDGQPAYEHPVMWAPFEVIGVPPTVTR